MTAAHRAALTAGVGLAAAATIQALVRRARRWDPAGRTVLVTGGSRGLGLDVARELLRMGARVAICGRDEDTLDRARADLERLGVAIAVRCDMTVKDDVDLLVKEVAARLGPIDALVNNAGLITVGPVETMEIEDFDDALDTNFWGPLHAIRAVMPEMRRRHAGRIVNIASIGGKIGTPHLAPYSASKFALVGLSETLRAELARDGIVVTTVCPGLMRTGSPRHAYFKGRHRAEFAWFSIGDSLPVLSMDAERAARQVVAALCSGEAERVLSLPAKIGALAHALSPGLTLEVMAIANRLLPTAGDEARLARVKGEDSTSTIAPSFVTRLGTRAEARHNQTA